ncbi:MAG: hypothetical protein ACRC6X_03625 [Culicoidibacterales bacterium]
MKTVNEVSRQILYNGFLAQTQNHLYILAGNSMAQKQALYQWYVQLHVCDALEGSVVCQKCTACQRVASGNFVNNIVITKNPEKKSVGIEEMKQLQNIFTISADASGARFFCIEEADLVTVQGANSILKFLEEPFGETIGFLFVKNEQKLLPTIRSRAQILRVVGVEISGEEQKVIAKKLVASNQQIFAQKLVSTGWDVKIICKWLPLMEANILAFRTKLGNGAPIIVALTDLESIAIKSKTGVLILEIFACMLEQELQKGEHLGKQPERLLIATTRALKLVRYNMGIGTILTKFALAFDEDFA